MATTLEIKKLEKAFSISVVYSISALVTTFWSLCFWFTFDSSIRRVIETDNASWPVISGHFVVFVIYAFFYYSIMKPHYEWVIRMVRSTND